MQYRKLFVFPLVLTAQFLLGCTGSLQKDSVSLEEKLDQQYTAVVTLDNMYKTGPLPEAPPSSGLEESMQLVHADDLCADFWIAFDAFRDRYGQADSVDLLRRLVRAHGLCMIMAFPVDAILSDRIYSTGLFLKRAKGRRASIGLQPRKTIIALAHHF